MTPQQKLKHLILLKHSAWNDAPDKLLEDASPEQIDEVYDASEPDGWELQDAREEVRSGEVETSIPSPSSRHYESQSVAARYIDGSWIGWTYWYGGGKHGEPEAVEWIEDAYDLTCAEEEKVVTVRTFAKVPA